MKKILFIGFLLLVEMAFAQSPYQFSRKKDAALLGGGMVSTGLGRYFSKQVTPLQFEDISAMSRCKVNGFDRFATFNYSPKAKNFSDVMLNGSHMLPLMLLIGKKTRSEFGKVALLWGEAYLLTTGVTYLSKSTILRSRPLVFNENFSESTRLSRDARFSFFSGHTSIAAVNSFFFAKVFSDYYPDSKLKPFVWGVAITVPALTAYARVAAGKHYPSDVIIGYGIGAAMGMLVPQLHKTRHQERKLTYYPGMGGGSMVWRF